MSQIAMQQYITKIYNDNKQLNHKLKELTKEKVPNHIIKEHAIALMYSDKEFMKEMLDTAIEICKDTIDNDH